MSSQPNDLDIPTLTALTDDQVADYLRRNPHFLLDNPALLADLKLLHEDKGDAVSLIEHQVGILRDRNLDMHHRLNKLLDNARANDALFDKTKQLILGLLDTTMWEPMINRLFYHLEISFSIEQASVVLLDNAHTWPEPVHKHLRIAPQTEVLTALGELMSPPHAACGCFDNNVLRTLFDDRATLVSSAAIAPLIHNNILLGVIAVGNQDPNFYRSSMNTLFLSFIADALSRLVTRFK